MNPVRAKLKHNIIVKDISTDDEVSYMYIGRHKDICR